MPPPGLMKLTLMQHDGSTEKAPRTYHKRRKAFLAVLPQIILQG